MITQTKRILSLLLLTAFAFPMVSCKKSTNSSESSSSGSDTASEFEETELNLVKDGVSEYTLVVPSESSDYEKMAKDEFITLFATATGVTLPVISDNGITHNENQKYISIGETSLLSSSGVQYDKNTLGEDGVRIVTKDGNLYLVGGSDSGSLYAVYDFMTLNFHYEQYFVDCMDIDKNVTDLPLLSYDYTDIPDIPFRVCDLGTLHGQSSYDAKMFGYRMRLNKDRGTFMMPIHERFDRASGSRKSTNDMAYLPYEIYYSEHPDWYSNNCLDGENQFCYTAHGNESEFRLMTEECAKKIEFSLQNYTPEEYPEMNVVTLTCSDNFNFCTCEACTEMQAKYGSEAGATVIFMNEVGRLVDEWQQKPENANYKRDNLRIIFFAYNNLEDPPVNIDEKTGVCTPVDEKVVCRDNIGIYLAICNNIDYQQSLFADINKDGKNQLDGWSVLSDFIYFWNYETNFRNYMYFYDSFSYFNAEAYKYFASKNVNMFFAEDQATSGETGTTWNNLKAYLNGKLMWDTSLDTDELTEKWFNAMYREASGEMKQLFYTMRAYNAKMTAENGFYKVRSNYNTLNRSKLWPLATLESFISACDHAKLAVEKYRETNPELYRSIVNHIEAEAFAPIYQILTLYSKQISEEYKDELKFRLLENISELHLESKKTAEHDVSSIAELIRTL